MNSGEQGHQVSSASRYSRIWAAGWWKGGGVVLAVALIVPPVMIKMALYSRLGFIVIKMV